MKRVLTGLLAAAVVTVAELVPAVVEWNRTFLGELAGHPLRDRRVRVQTTDVGFTMRAKPAGFDAILLDTDNGPAAFTATTNAGLYDNGGVVAAFAALRPGGTLAVWSAWDDRKFEQRLRFYGFRVTVERVRARLHQRAQIVDHAHKPLDGGKGARCESRRLRRAPPTPSSSCTDMGSRFPFAATCASRNAFSDFSIAAPTAPPS